MECCETMKSHTIDEENKVRLDKWLWAARFYKTRALAKQMIEGGKVFYQGQRTKCSKWVEMGAEITLRQGMDEKRIIVRGLSEQRQGAQQAQLLYEETAASVSAREENTAQRKMFGQAPEQRPDKKSRRELLRVKGRLD